MEIIPNSNIILLKNVPLDLSYKNTMIIPASHINQATGETIDYTRDERLNMQYDIFRNGSYYLTTLNKHSYQRHSLNAINVEKTLDELFECNYMIIENSVIKFGIKNTEKKIYCFVTDIEYVNETTSRISYVIDVMQTFMLDYELHESFVEREHAATDTPGENLVEENLEIGDYIDNGMQLLDENQGTYIIIVTTFHLRDDNTVSPVIAGLTSGVYSGLEYNIFENEVDANNFLARIPENYKADGIISIYMSPWKPAPSASEAPSYTVEIAPNLDYGPFKARLDGYEPKNKKLLTFPYNIYHMQNDSASADFKYEYFHLTPETGKMQFLVSQTVFPEPCQIIAPQNYLRSSDGATVLGEKAEYRICTQGFPQCAVNSDVYKVFMAQNSNALAAKQRTATEMALLSVPRAFAQIGGGFANALIGSSTSPIPQTRNINGGAAAGGRTLNYYPKYSPLAEAHGIGQMVTAPMGLIESKVQLNAELRSITAMKHDLQTRPPQATGTQTCSLDYAAGYKKTYGHYYTIRNEYARKIDSYFDLYGYATNEFKKPNRNCRKNWTYVKTVGCNITSGMRVFGQTITYEGGVPADYLQVIKTVYDSGVTFWNNINNIGEYTLKNPPTGKDNS